MLLKMTDLKAINVDARDGAVGSIEDALFDDERWVIRYLVVNTRARVGGRKVLISPLAIERFDPGEQKLHLILTQKAVDESPPIEAHLPVSRAMEEEINRYYGFPNYWAFGASGPIWGWGTVPVLPAEPLPEPPPQEERDADPDAHLRSAAEVRGYHIKAIDQTFGHLEDLVFDTNDWAIRYLLLDTRNWWPGSPVIVRPNWAREIDWASRTISMDIDAEQIRSSPRYDADSTLTREYEEALHQHYERTPYWLE